MNPTRDPLGLVGESLGEYRIEEFVTAGGIAAVYRAFHTVSDEQVAVKVLDARHADLERAKELEERFHREANACMALKNPHTIRLLGHGSTPQGLHYMALEWLEGETLHERMRSQGHAAPLSLIRIILQLCNALTESHTAGIVHRDLKPGNILLIAATNGGDYVKLLDFGLAKHLDADVTLTRAGAVMGTPTYMSPEQIEGAQHVDHRTDIYAIGVMMFRGLTNKRPFGGKRPTEVMVGHLRKPVPAMSAVAPDIHVPRNVEWLVRTCMNKSRDDRFESAEELRLALRACELELIDKLPDQVHLTIVNGRLDVSNELRQLLETPDTVPEPTPAPAPRATSSLPAVKSRKPPSMNVAWLGLGIGAVGFVGFTVFLAYAML